jgi:hypothetical protein
MPLASQNELEIIRHTETSPLLISPTLGLLLIVFLVFKRKRLKNNKG